jgi:hypothetical protein
MIIRQDRIYTKGNTDSYMKKFDKNLQVKKRSIMFVFESKIFLENKRT